MWMEVEREIDEVKVWKLKEKWMRSCRLKVEGEMDELQTEYK